MRWFGWLRRGRRDDRALSSQTAMIAGRMRTRGLPYMMPNDIEELNRLDFQHFMLRTALRGNYLAPIRQPESILDIGTGTGRWALELAALFPQANVVGLDVNPPPIDEAAESALNSDPRPPNYSFVPGNVLEGLPFADGSFDFVHMRALLAAIPHDRWPTVAIELARVTRARGWVESLEVTELERGGPAIEDLLGWLRAAMARRSVEFADGGKVGDCLRAARLANVSTRAIRLPCGDYGGRVGKMVAADWFNVFKAMSAVMVMQGLTTTEAFEEAYFNAQTELADPSSRCVMPVFIAIGQRAS